MTEPKNLNKSLSIRISTNGLSFCSYTPLAASPFCYKVYDVKPTISLAANLKDALINEPMLKEEYQRVNVLITTPHTTFMPVADFNADDVEKIYSYNFPKDSGIRVSYNVLRRSGVAVIFGMDKNVYQLLFDDFPQARYYASSSTLIEFMGSRCIQTTCNVMYAYLHEKELTLYAFQSGRMVCTNSYSANNADDYMYYILSLFQTLGFSQTEDQLRIVGDTGRENELAKRIQNFLKNVNVTDRRTDFLNSITAGEALIPYDLQSLLVCGF